MTDNGRLLEVRGLSAGYGAGPVLFGIDLDVAAGELVVEDPSLGWAPNVVDRGREVIKTINRDGTAVLLVEQDVVLALDIADRGYVLENGRIVLTAPAAELRRDPAIRKAYLGI